MKALVTGATGFIGSHLVRALRARGDDVTCLVRETSRRDALERIGARSAVGDLGDPESLRAAVEGQEAVFHLAALLKAPWKREFLPTNVDGPRNVARACAAVARPPVLVLVSSLAAAGPSPDAGEWRRAEADPPAPVSRYGRAKLAGEEACAAAAGATPVTIVRPPSVFGPGDRGCLALFRMAARGLFVVPTRARRRLALVHVEDLVELLIRAAERGERVSGTGTGAGTEGKGIYFGAFDEQPTFDDLGRRIAAALGRGRLHVLRLPEAIAAAACAAGEALGRLRDRPTVVNLDKAREARAGSWTCESAKAARDLGWRPARSLDERLRETAAWYRTEGWIG